MMIVEEEEEDDSETQSLTFKLSITLPSDTPVVGIQISPYALLHPFSNQHSLTFTWYRKETCFSLWRYGVKLNLPTEETYQCCFANEWINHAVGHRQAADAIAAEKAPPLQKEESEWVEVGNSKSYVPTLDDLGYSLRLETVVVDTVSGARLPFRNTLDTKPVIAPPIFRPRKMIQCTSFEAVDHSTNDMTFTVLSYNVLADLYASISSQRYKLCPTWAQVWEYRREHLLHEIIGYDADIVCLQEVQSDHFENFFGPKLRSHGYSVSYKKKAMQLYAENKYVSEGCATFYRRKLFKEIAKHELEFDKMALQYTQTLEHNVKTSHRLSKDNVALVLTLETLDSDSYKCSNLVRSKICVANTHISASSEFPDVKLFQVVSLVNELEGIVHSGIPLIICGDFNSVPLSDPHTFIVTGKCEPEYDEQQDPLGIFNNANLSHSLPLASAYPSLVSLDDEGRPRKIYTKTKNPSRSLGTLDYIFYTENSLRVESILDLLDHESLRSGLPSPYWPSDHMALMARFRLYSTKLLVLDATKLK